MSGLEESKLKLAEIYGNNLATMRQVRGMSLDDLAGKVNLSRGMINGLELCRNNTSFDNMEIIANALKVSPAAMFVENFVETSLQQAVINIVQ